MAIQTRKIGLSLGADICWPICFEAILDRLSPTVRVGRDEIRFAVERLTIEPFDLQQTVDYDLVIDRLTHWYNPTREWIKKAVIMDDLYVFNNPWSVQSMTKQTTYCAMMQLGMPVPKTMLLPPKEYESNPDLEPTLQRYARYFDLAEIGERVGYPLFMKPYDGGGWVGVSKIDDEAALRAAYEESGRFIMHVQRGLLPFDRFVRCIGIGPQCKIVEYDPGAPLHERYRPELDLVAAGRITEDEAQHIRDTTLTINSFFGWDFNSCELIRRDGVWHPFDFANPCPDSQVTSLGAHFPWVVLSQMRWALYCVATRRKMHRNLDWLPFYAAAGTGRDYPEKLAGYGAIARGRFEAERFEEFCATQLADLDAVALEFFATDQARDAVRQKVQALFPEHEWDGFTRLFFDRIQDWRAFTAERR